MKRNRLKPRARTVGALSLLLLCVVCGAPGCSIKKFALNKLGDSLAETGTVYAADNDIELVGGALPFSLKLVEGLLASTPKHQGLLFTAASGFTQYAYVYVQQEADFVEGDSLAKATELRARAQRLYLRARDYGLRGLDGHHAGFSEQVKADALKAAQTATKADVPLLYWTAAAWGSAIALSKENPAVIADQPVVEALIDRAFALDPDFDAGAIHGFLITYELSRQGATGDPLARSRSHFDQAVALSKGQLASPFLSLAEGVSVQTQNREEFRSLVKRALAVDPDARPEWRLQNLVLQRRARWLTAHEDDLFAN
jgi:predicted anti-sigma-YlaC factor YlaD